MEDSLGDRIWVDLEACKKLVDNICTLFQTKPYSPGGVSNSGSGMGTGTGTGSLPSGADSPSGDGGETSGVGAGDGKHNEELSLADVEVDSRYDSCVCVCVCVHVCIYAHGILCYIAYRTVLTNSAHTTPIKVVCH